MTVGDPARFGDTVMKSQMKFSVDKMLGGCKEEA